jgi:hypothetical protein
MFEDYTSKRLQLRRPPLALSILWVVGGGIIILILLASVLINYKLFSNIYQFGLNLIEMGEFEDALDLISRVALLTLAVFAGIHKIPHHGIQVYTERDQRDRHPLDASQYSRTISRLCRS